MPLHNKSDRSQVDIAIAEYLETLYALPKEAAIAAFNELAHLKMMREHEKSYPPLPALFQNKVYQTEEIQQSLKMLSEIMFNCQPQNPAQYSEDQKEHRQGKLNLLELVEQFEEVRQPDGTTTLKSKGKSLQPVHGETITAQDVHDYMQYKFADAAFNAIALHEAKKIIDNVLKKDSDIKINYYKHFAKWVSDTNKLPKELRNLFLNNQLKQKIQDALKIYLSQEKFKLFSSCLDKNDLNSATEQKESKVSKSQALITTDDIIQHLFSLHPGVLDKATETGINTLSGGILFYDDATSLVLTIFKTPPYKEVREKLEAQIEDPDEFFSIDVISSFLKVAEIRETLNRHGNEMKEENYASIVIECDKICAEYVKHLKTTTEEEQKPLEKEKLEKLNRGLKNVKEFIKEKEFIDWASKFFSLYFAPMEEDNEQNRLAKQNEQNTLLTQLFDYVFNQNRVEIPDTWFRTIHDNNLLNKTGEEKGSVDFKPHHINRVFLHALTLPVERWSTAFYNTLCEMLDLLDRSNDPSNQELKQYSYPTGLITQIRWLRDLYAASVLNIGEIPHKPNAEFPMLYYPYDRAEMVILARRLKLVPLDKVLTFFENLKYPSTKAIMSIEYVAPLLILYTPQQIHTILESIKDQLPTLIPNIPALANVFYNLDPNQRMTAEQLFYICERVINDLPQIIHNAKDLSTIKFLLTPDQRSRLATNLYPRLKEMIENPSPEGFNFICESMHTDEGQAFFNLLKNDFPRIITSISSFNRVMSSLHPFRRIIFCEEVKNQLPRIIQKKSDFMEILTYLTPNQITTLFQNFTNLNPQLFNDCFKNITDFNMFTDRHRYFNREQIIAIYKNLIHYFPNLMLSSDNVAALFNALNKYYKYSHYHIPSDAVFESLKNHWPVIIKEAKDVANVFPSLTKEQAIFVRQCLNEPLQQEAKTSVDSNPLPNAKEKDKIEKDKDIILINMLEDYKKDRSKTPETSNFFAYSKDIKTKAATELQESIANGTQLESIYIGPLSQGKLSNEIKIFLAKYRPGITLEVFLKSMTSLPPRPPRPK